MRKCLPDCPLKVLTTSQGAIVEGTETNAHGLASLRWRGFPIAFSQQWGTGCPSIHPGSHRGLISDISESILYADLEDIGNVLIY